MEGFYWLKRVIAMDKGGKQYRQINGNPQESL